MNIVMKYPEIEGKKLCDGSLHEIRPEKIEKLNINGTELFLLDYWDGKYNCNCFTILRKEQNNFIKVPLKSYDDLIRKISDGKIISEAVELSLLDGVKAIFCDEPIDSINDLGLNTKEINEINRRKLVEDACGLFLKATYWRNGNLAIPEPLKSALLLLNSIDIDRLSLPAFKSFLEDLRKNLINSITTEKDGTILLGPADVKVVDAVKGVYSLVNRYFDNTSKEENIVPAYKFAVSDAGSTPPPPGGPIPLPVFFNNMYMYKYPPRKQAEFDDMEEKNVFKYYIALDNDFYENGVFSDYQIASQHKNYINTNTEYRLAFHKSYSPINRCIIPDYISKVKNGECILMTPLGITVDREKGCYYYGYNNEVKDGFFIEYNFAICDSRDKMVNINNQHITIDIPEDCPYRHISRDSFFSETFRYGIEGGYTLSTADRIFQGDSNKLNYWRYDAQGETKKGK